MKKVLMLAYIFPPLGGSGVQRTTKFARYLPQFGWQPLVVCGDDPEAFQTGYDHSLEDELPSEVKVYRRPYVSPLGLRRRFQRSLGVKTAREVASAQRTQVDSRVAAPARAPKLSPVRRAARLLTAPLGPFEFPPIDSGLYWALSIVPFCRRIIQEEGVDLIYSTSFPYSDHLAAALLHQQTGLPWVADFRDPWTRNLWSHNTGWRQWVDCRMEQWVLRHASRVVGVTPTYTQGLRELAPRRAPADFLTIENGFDPADFTTAPAPAPAGSHSGPAVLAHVGMVYEGIALPVLQALQDLNSEDKARIAFRFVGGMADMERQFLTAHPNGTSVQVTERVSHDQALRVMTSADVLLLLISTRPGWGGNYPGKIFEYLASGRPVLMVGPEGEASRLIESSGTGCFVPAGDRAGIARVLSLLARSPAEFRARYYQPRPEVIARFERRALTCRLAQAFDQLTMEQPAHA